MLAPAKLPAMTMAQINLLRMVSSAKFESWRLWLEAADSHAFVEIRNAGGNDGLATDQAASHSHRFAHAVAQGDGALVTVIACVSTTQT